MIKMILKEIKIISRLQINESKFNIAGIDLYKSVLTSK